MATLSGGADVLRVKGSMDGQYRESASAMIQIGDRLNGERPSRRAAALLCCLLVAGLSACAEQDGMPAPPPADRSADSVLTSQGPDARAGVIRLQRRSDGTMATVLLRASDGQLNMLIDEDPAADRSLPMDARLDLLRPLVDSALRIDGRRETRDLTVGVYPELAARLAAAALCGDGWNPRNGQHDSGNAGRAVVSLLEDEQLIHELSAFFSPLGLDVSVRSAESIVLCGRSELDDAAMVRSCPLPPPADAVLPCGAELLFRLQSSNDPSRE